MIDDEWSSEVFRTTGSMKPRSAKHTINSLLDLGIDYQFRGPMLRAHFDALLDAFDDESGASWIDLGGEG